MALSLRLKVASGIGLRGAQAGGVAVGGAPVAERVEERERVAALDGVRGIAILMVLVFHFRLAAAVGPRIWIDEFALKTSIAGWTGVDLFFVLSGFLITGILLDAKISGERYFRNFYSRRVLRIFPAYYLFLGAVLIALPLIGLVGHAARDALWDDSGWYAVYLANIQLPVDGRSGAEVSYAGHLWSLAVEEQFYLVWPALVLLLDRRSLLAACAGFIIGAPIVRIVLAQQGIDSTWGYMLTPARMDALAVGGFIAIAARGSWDLRSWLRWLWPVAVVAVGVLITLAASREFLSPYDAWVQGVGFSAVALLFGVVLLAAITAQPESRVHRALTVIPLTSLGRYSYALYLVHWPVATILAQHFHAADTVPTLFGSSLPASLVFSLAAGAISFALAWASYHLWEKHFLKLKARFPYEQTAPVEAPLVAAVSGAVS
jgi:peptidoglycan/LPS O-acetylase OafA/YrhL